MLLRAVLMEHVPVGHIVMGVRETQGALLRDAGRLAKGNHVRMAPAAGPIGAAAMDDSLIVHGNVACM